MINNKFFICRIYIMLKTVMKYENIQEKRMSDLIYLDTRGNSECLKCEKKCDLVVRQVRMKDDRSQLCKYLYS